LRVAEPASAAAASRASEYAQTNFHVAADPVELASGQPTKQAPIYCSQSLLPQALQDQGTNQRYQK